MCVLVLNVPKKEAIFEVVTYLKGQ